MYDKLDPNYLECSSDNMEMISILELRQVFMSANRTSVYGY